VLNPVGWARLFFSVIVVCSLLCEATLSCAAEPAFKAGETIRYTIKQGPFKVGDATLRFDGEQDLDGHKAIRITFESKGPAFFDNEQIYVDPVTYRPVKVFRDLKIFGGHEKITEDYTTVGGIRITKDADGKVSETLLQKKEPVDNIYGFIYRYRLGGQFAASERIDVRLPTIDVVFRIINETSFNAAGKTYRAALMKSVPEKYSIWMDKGDKRLPLRIGGAVGIGNTMMTMVGVEEK
jgi:hypothetical protein